MEQANRQGGPPLTIHPWRQPTKAALAALAVGALTLGFAAWQAQGTQGNSSGLWSVSSFDAIADLDARSVALFEEMGKVLQHPRCVSCHPRTDRPLQGDAGLPHNPSVVRGPDGHGAPGLECSTCHGSANVTLATGGSIPGHPQWHLAPPEMAWEGKTLAEICVQLKDRSRNGRQDACRTHRA